MKLERIKRKILGIVKSGIEKEKEIKKREIKSIFRVTKKIVDSLIVIPSDIEENYYYDGSYGLSIKGQSIVFLDNTIYLLNVIIKLHKDKETLRSFSDDIYIKAENKDFNFLLEIRNFFDLDLSSTEYVYALNYSLITDRIRAEKEYLEECYPGLRYDYNLPFDDMICINQPFINHYKKVA